MLFQSSLVGLQTRIRRILSDQFERRRRSSCCRRIPESVEIRAGNSEQSGLAPCCTSGQTACDPRYTVFVIADADVQSKCAGQSPIVLEKDGPVVLVNVSLSPDRNFVVLECRCRWAVDDEALSYFRHGSGQRRKQVFCRSDIVVFNPGNAAVVIPEMATLPSARVARG